MYQQTDLGRVVRGRVKAGANPTRRSAGLPSVQFSNDVGHLDHCADAARAGVDRLRVPQLRLHLEHSNAAS
jgi:hypothetical protein